jgi:hypothetical protein
VSGILILVPVTVYDVPVVYSTWRIVSIIFVVDSVVELIVPLVKLGTTVLAIAGVHMTPAANSKAGVRCFI